MLDESDDVDDELEADIVRHTKQVYANLVGGLLVLFVALGGAVGGVATLVHLNNTADALLAIKPENRADMFRKKIASVRKRVKGQYADYEARMKDKSIYAISNIFKVLYKVTIEEEQDYGRLLRDYSDASYELASRVRGSGEWYYYYEREVGANIRRQRAMETQMKDYLSRH